VWTCAPPQHRQGPALVGLPSYQQTSHLQHQQEWPSRQVVIKEEEEEEEEEGASWGLGPPGGGVCGLLCCAASCSNSIKQIAVQSPLHPQVSRECLCSQA
jgi:hypothetical protein